MNQETDQKPVHLYSLLLGVELTLAFEAIPALTNIVKVVLDKMPLLSNGSGTLILIVLVLTALWASLFWYELKRMKFAKYTNQYYLYLAISIPLHSIIVSIYIPTILKLIGL